VCLEEAVRARESADVNKDGVPTPRRPPVTANCQVAKCCDIPTVGNLKRHAPIILSRLPYYRRPCQERERGREGERERERKRRKGGRERERERDEHAPSRERAREREIERER